MEFSLISSGRIVVELGLRVSVTVRVLQLKVGTGFLPFPFQTKFSGQFLLSSLPPPLATFPDAKSDKGKEEDQAPKEDVGPPAQNLCL